MCCVQQCRTRLALDPPWFGVSKMFKQLPGCHVLGGAAASIPQQRQMCLFVSFQG
jgi:hypothetical protein